MAGFIISILGFLSFACKKNGGSDEAALYGTWVKGPDTGDTLWFMQKSGKFIVRVPESFNPSMPKYSEKEYRFKDGVLNIKLFMPASDEYFPMTSFTWTDPGKEFTIQNSQLFIFLSSMITYKYKKI
jgi:hypothetical protein